MFTHLKNGKTSFQVLFNSRKDFYFGYNGINKCCTVVFRPHSNKKSDLYTIPLFVNMSLK